MSKRRLTPQDVKALPPAGAAYRDDLAPGLVLRVRLSGARSFAVEYSRGGRTRRYTIGATPPLTLADARERAREVMSLVLAGRDPQAEKATQLASSITIKDLTNRCLDALELRPGTTDEYRRLADVELIPTFGARAAAELTRSEIRAAFRKLAKRAPYVANRAFGLLRRVYSWAAGEDLVLVTPFVGLTAPGTERASDRVLTTAELRALLLALDDLPGQYSDAVQLLLLTLARRSMVVGAREPELEDLDGQRPQWIVPAERMKGDRPHVIPLSAAAVAVFKRRLEVAPDDAVFPPLRPSEQLPVMTWSSDYVDRLRAAVDKHYRKLAGLDEKAEDEADAVPRWKIHNLRHTAATHLSEDLRVPFEVISKLLAHTPPGAAVSRIYNRAELLLERRAALVAWADWLRKLKAGAGVMRGKVLPLSR